VEPSGRVLAILTTTKGAKQLQCEHDREGLRGKIVLQTRALLPSLPRSHNSPTRPPLPPRPGHPSSQLPPRTPPPAAPSQHPASPLRAATSSQTSAESATIRGCGAPTLPPEGPTEQALAPLRASEGRRACPVSGPRRGGCSRGGQRGAPGRTAPRSPRSAPSQPGAPASYVSRPRPDVGRYRRPDAARRGPTPTRPRRARCADPVRPSRPLASACRAGQPP